MRVLMVGADSNYAIERFYLQHFKEDKDTVVAFFAAQNIFLEYYTKNIFRKIIFRLGYERIYDKINNLLKSQITMFEPDVLFVFKGMEIFPGTLLWAKERGIRLVNYNPDNPFIFTGKGSGNANITNSVALYDLHFTYNLDVKEKIDKQYQIPTYYLPFGFEFDEDLFVRCTKLDEVNKLCFLGNPDKQRASFILQLLSLNIPIDLYGHRWEHFVRHPLATCYPAVFGEQYWEILHRYRVQLNIMRIHNEDSHNMRTFEIPAIGGIMLAPRTSEHAAFFIDKKEAFFFSDILECVQVVNQLINTETKDMLLIRAAAREKSIKQGYSYKDRADSVLLRLKMLFDE